MGGEMNKKELLNEMCYDCKYYPCPTLKNGDHCCTYNGLAEALEKQIPKKPIKSDREIRYCEVWKCPSCGFEWSARAIDYCYRCGQRLDWEGTE